MGGWHWQCADGLDVRLPDGRFGLAFASIDSCYFRKLSELQLSSLPMNPSAKPKE
jgi:hypothetical protein